MISLARLRLAPLAALALLSLFGVSGAPAQVAAAKSPWQAWIGCWQPVIEGSSDGPRVCVVPTTVPSAVDVVTVDSVKALARYIVDASGRQRAVEYQGCTGWERSQWSSDSARVFFRSELSCGPGRLKRTTSGIMSISPNGEWVDAQTVIVGASEVVRTVRYRESARTDGLPAEAVSLLAGSRRLERQTIAAGTRLTTANIIEASRAIDTSAVRAWLVERGAADVRANARTVVELADAGVAGSIVDVVVALAYPEQFHFDRGDGDDDAATTMRPRSAVAASSYSPRLGACDPLDYYSTFGWGSSACYGYGRQLSRNGYGGYGYPGYSYGSPYYGRYTRPIVVVRGPEPEHGQAMKGEGYTQRRSGSSTGASATRGRSTGSSSGGARTTSSGSGRTAKARPPK